MDFWLKEENKNTKFKDKKIATIKMIKIQRRSNNNQIQMKNRVRKQETQLEPQKLTLTSKDQ